MEDVRRVSACALAAPLTLSACTGSASDRRAREEPPDPTGGPGRRDEPALTVLARDLEAPWGVAFLPDGSALITERDTALIKHRRPDGSVRTVQRLAEVDSGGEGGLMGIAVSPAYAEDRLVYVYYTTSRDNRIARLRLGERPTPILTGIPVSGIHNGGRLAFGPDGYLYAGTGDASDRGLSQDRSNLGGKVLRMTAEGRPAPGNPFRGSVVWSLGHRNVQGLAWDDAGRLFASEFGQSQWDEVNRIERGRNYGWPDVEGRGGRGRFVDPLVTWEPSEASPSGIAIVNQALYVACLRGERLWRVPISADGRVGRPQPLLVGRYGRLRHVAVAPDGSLWILTSNRDGRGSPAADDDRILRLSTSASSA